MKSKHIVYRYNGDPKSEEVFTDLGGELPLYSVGEVIVRNGKQWKVAAINDEITVAGAQAIPIHRVFLTDSL